MMQTPTIPQAAKLIAASPTLLGHEEPTGNSIC